MRTRHLLPPVLAVLVAAAIAVAAPGDNTRISLSDADTQTLAQQSFGSGVSADGRYVLFTNRDALAGVTTGNFLQLYVRDRIAGTTRLVSSSAAGAAANADVDEDQMNHPYAISGDGRYVTFSTIATNLVVPDGNAAQKDVFRKDLQTGEIIVVSVNDAGQQANVGVQGNPDISGDGNRIALVTGAATTNLFPNDTNNAMDIVVRDVAAGKTILASQSSAGVLANNFTERPAISADGRFVVFEAFMGTDNLVGDDDNAASDTFIRDLALNTTQRVSIATDGSDPGGTNFPDVSGNGRYVVWQSPSMFDPVNDTNVNQDVYRRDVQTGTTVLVSAKNGVDANGAGASTFPQISADGSRVAFESDEGTLLPPDLSVALADVYIRDVPTKVIQRANTPQTANAAISAGISGNGAIVTFTYNDFNNVPFLTGDNNALPDVFAHEFAPSDAAPPALALTAPLPATGAVTPALQVTVAGTVSDPSGIVALTVAGSKVTPGADGSFSSIVPIALGANSITITAVDGAGNTATTTRSVTRTAPVTPPGPQPQPQPPGGRLRPGVLSLASSPARDLTAPFRFVISGRLGLRGLTLAAACKGGVTIRARAGTRVIRTVRTGLKVSRGQCVYRGTLTFRIRAPFGSASSIRVQVSFAGNGLLLSKVSSFRSLRVR